VCNICLEDLGGVRVEQGVEIVKCRHRFCRDCIDKWASIKKECPVCKGKSVKYRLLKKKVRRNWIEVEGEWSDDDRPVPTAQAGP